MAEASRERYDYYSPGLEVGSLGSWVGLGTAVVVRVEHGRQGSSHREGLDALASDGWHRTLRFESPIEGLAGYEGNDCHVGDGHSHSKNPPCPVHH